MYYNEASAFGFTNPSSDPSKGCLKGVICQCRVSFIPSRVRVQAKFPVYIKQNKAGFDVYTIAPTHTFLKYPIHNLNSHTYCSSDCGHKSFFTYWGSAWMFLELIKSTLCIYLLFTRDIRCGNLWNNFIIVEYFFFTRWHR